VEPRVRRAECILANKLVLGTLVLAPPMTAIRHGRDLCLPDDDVEARSTSLQRNKCLHPSRHDGVGSGAILRYGWLDFSSSVFYDYCGRVCSGAHRCVPLLLLVAAAEPFVVGREGLVLGLLAWWCVSMVLHGASWRLAMALDQVRVGCFPGRCATSDFCSSFGAASFAAPAKASAIWRALLVSGGCRRLWFLVLAAAARIHGGSCWWQAQSSSQSCLYFSYVIGAFVQSWWTPVLLYPSRARLCVHVYLCCLFSY